mmetsp:Transcript_91272/g.295111  ORF Transcript_91272/g.295111 Transcript_91272/m.295111 type:complete len:263 (-) Transcript_91272:100-888(-)
MPCRVEAHAQGLGSLRLDQLLHGGAVLEVGALAGEVREEAVVLCPLDIAVRREVARERGLGLHRRVQRLELREGVQDVGLADGFANARVLVQHLEEHEVAALRLGSAHVGAHAEALELREVRGGGSSDVLLGALRELLLRLDDAAKRVHDLHQIVAQVHRLVKHGVVLREVGIGVGAQLPAEIERASVRLSDHVFAVHDVRQVDARVLLGQRRLHLAEPLLFHVRAIARVDEFLPLVIANHAKRSTEATNLVVADDDGIRRH